MFQINNLKAHNVKCQLHLNKRKEHFPSLPNTFSSSSAYRRPENLKYNGDRLSHLSLTSPGTLGKSPLSSKAPSNSNIQRLGVTAKHKSGHVIHLVGLAFRVLNYFGFCYSQPPLDHGPLWPSPVPSTQDSSPPQSLCIHSSPCLHTPPRAPPTLAPPHHSGLSSNVTSSELIPCHPNQTHTIILFLSVSEILRCFLDFRQSSLLKHRFHESIDVLRTGPGTYRFSIITCWMNEHS